jgi:hypothetical protein
MLWIMLVRLPVTTDILYVLVRRSEIDIKLSQQIIQCLIGASLININNGPNCLLDYQS